MRKWLSRISLVCNQLIEFSDIINAGKETVTLIPGDSTFGKSIQY